MITKKSLILGTISILSIFLGSCCKTPYKQGSLKPDWSIPIPTGASDYIYYTGLNYLPKYNDIIVAHTSLTDDFFKEDNRLCAINISTRQVEWYFPGNLSERHYAFFDGKSYLWNNRLVFRYQKDARDRTKLIHTLACIEIETGALLWEIDDDIKTGHGDNLDVTGNGSDCYFIKNNTSVCLFDIQNYTLKSIYSTSKNSFINYFSLTDDGNLLIFEYNETIRGENAYFYNATAKIINPHTRDILHSITIRPIGDQTSNWQFPAKGKVVNGILYANRDTYIAAIDIINNAILWERDDIFAHTIQALYEYKNILVKCGVNATVGYDSRTGDIKFAFRDYSCWGSCIDGQYVYIDRSDKIDILDLEASKIVDYIPSQNGETYSSSYPTICGNKVYTICGNSLCCYPIYPWY